MYMSTGNTEAPGRASEATSAAFKRAAIALLAADPGPFTLVAMTSDLTVRVVARFAAQAQGEAELAARAAESDDAFVGLFRKDVDSDAGWWSVGIKKVASRPFDWKLPAAVTAFGLAMLWLVANPAHGQKRRR